MATPPGGDVYIVAAARTPIGTLGGALSAVPATELGAAVIAAAVERSGVPGDRVDEVYMGQVLQAGAGQAPARQAALAAGLPESVPATTVSARPASGASRLCTGMLAI